MKRKRKRNIAYITILGLCAIFYGSARQYLPGGIEYEYAQAQEPEGEPEGESIEMMVRNVGESVGCINFRVPELRSEENPDGINPIHVGPRAKVQIHYQILDEYGDPASEWLWCRERIGVEAGERVQFRYVKCAVPDRTLIRFRGLLIAPSGNRSVPALAVWTDNLESVAVCEIDTELPPTITATVEE